MKMNKKTRTRFPLFYSSLVLASSMIFSACNGADVSSASGELGDAGVTNQPYQSYVVKLLPLNTDWNAGKLSGVGTFQIEGSSMITDIKMQGLGGPMDHLIQMREKGICPAGDSADSNQDGIIDGFEGEHFYGVNFYSMDDAKADENGILSYRKETTIPHFKLAERALVVYGVVEELLPLDAFQFPWMTPSSSLPVACGVIKTVSLSP